ncbi:LAMI_0B00408g1_1 [Lachancea mirantina]|uniref:Ubiquitin carboxyl-terminal hydrolase n=1 Tax=Lachancea mirantina TaxID=1230905 RepID=A0A1G4ISS4_9SACH|nr:LAMI_0B00408g1_1 [Lachancea mirantina]
MPELFTPEYSNELLQFIQEIYSQDIAHFYPRLRLEKMLDLLEHAEYLFESYRTFLQKSQTDDALTAYVVGCFYIYLIIPHSIQFHSRDKSYGIYTDLQKYYREEANMTNVLLMVTKKIEKLTKVEAEGRQYATINRRRAYSVPPKSLEQQLESFSMGTKNAPAQHMKRISSIEDNSTMWRAPDITPNDQLEIAVATVGSSNSSIQNSQASHKALTSLGNSLDKFEGPPSGMTKIRHESTPTFSLNDELSAVDEAINTVRPQDVDRYETHRKDSYHSVYMTNDDGNDDSLFNLTRLQKQSLITCDQLMDILNSNLKHSLLLIDLRLPRRFESNHLVAPNTINFNPQFLWDFKNNQPVDSDRQLNDQLKSDLFKNRSHFRDIVYYTDMKSFLHFDFDYQLSLFKILYTSSARLRCVPRVLLGGYEQWKKFIGAYSAKHNVPKELFLYRSSSTSHSKSAPPPVPSSMPPPLPPGAAPSLPSQPAPDLPPPDLPAKGPISKLASKPQKPVHSIHSLPPQTPQAPDHSTALHSTADSSHLPVLANREHASVPTIERSRNTYVALSITGLRNLGSTCYINSMLQCLFATKTLRELFVTSKYQDYLTPSKKHDHPLSKSLNQLFKKMYMNGGCSVVPNGFLKTCNSLRPDLRIPNDQQDTQEFLLFLLSQLHDELSDSQKVGSDYPQLLLHDDEKLCVDSKEYNKWFDSNLQENGISPIDRIFQGQMENSLQCQRCGYCSYNYSIFYVLSLAIPASTNALGKSKKVRLEDCINLFTNDEELKGENAWDCPKCGSAVSQEDNKKRKRRFLSSEHRQGTRASRFFQLRSKNRNRSVSPYAYSGASEKWTSRRLSTIKTLNFITLPPVLVIHLSRFYYDLTKKNSAVITYPLILSIELKNGALVHYRLYAIVNHFGNLISGHYTSLVNKNLKHEIRRGEQKWYYFDDEIVKKDDNHGDYDAGIISVSSSDVYVLFYEQITIG